MGGFTKDLRLVNSNVNGRLILLLFRATALACTMSKHRYHEIDLLRGVACLMVVAFHFLYRGQKAGWIDDAPPAAVALAASYGYLGVHLFFIISGFVIFMSAESGTVRAFAASRAARLYPAIWVAAPLTALVAATFSSPHFQVSWSTVLVNMTLAPHWFGVEFVDGAYWSLAVELHFYILVALALAAGWMHRAEWLIAGWLLLAGANLVRPMFPLEFWAAVKWAPLFCAGACAYLIRSRGSSGVRLALLAAAYLLAMAATVGPTLHPAPGDPHAASPVVTGGLVTLFHLIFLAIAFDRWRLGPSVFATWAGLLTYPVYLVHQNIGYVLLDALRPAIDSFAGRLDLVSAVIAVLAWAIVVAIERPLSATLRQALAPRRHGPATST